MTVKSACLGESPSTQVASVRSFPRVSSAMSPEGGNIGETSSATSTSVRLLPSVGSLVQLQVGLPGKRLLTLVALERLQARVDQHVLGKLAWSLEHSLALRAFVHRSLRFGFLWQCFLEVLLKHSCRMKLGCVLSQLRFSCELFVANIASNTGWVFVQVLMSLPR